MNPMTRLRPSSIRTGTIHTPFPIFTFYSLKAPCYISSGAYYVSGAAIGVSMDDDGRKSVKPFLEEHMLNYPVVIANQDLAKHI
jgi:hypothetical protein